MTLSWDINRYLITEPGIGKELASFAQSKLLDFQLPMLTGRCIVNAAETDDDELMGEELNPRSYMFYTTRG